jgi:hypothetical protein
MAEKVESFQEGWMRGVAITTTVLAVMTAIVSARTATCVSKIQVLTAQEGSNWSYYQAKSIKHNLAENQKRAFAVEVLGAANAEQKAALNQELTTLTSEMARYDQEKAEIKKMAEDSGAQRVHVQKQNNLFVVSIALFQIAIMLSSVAALIKRKELWIVGLVFGVFALFFFANGFFLFMPLPFIF